jgi:hypothetical protein
MECSLAAPAVACPREWGRHVAGFYIRNNTSQVIAYNHYFARQG